MDLVNSMYKIKAVFGSLNEYTHLKATKALNKCTFVSTQHVLVTM